MHLLLECHMSEETIASSEQRRRVRDISIVTLLVGHRAAGKAPFETPSVVSQFHAAGKCDTDSGAAMLSCRSLVDVFSRSSRPPPPALSS